MKKTLVLSALVLVIALSMVSGTLAVYTRTLAPYDGNVVAKEFILFSEGTVNFDADVLIAPDETVELVFTVANTDGILTSEVPMDLDISVDFAATTGKSIIEPLTATVLKGATVVSTGSLTDGAGTLTITDALGAPAAETLTFTIVIEWPSTADDTDYAGADFGTTATVTVTGTQS